MKIWIPTGLVALICFASGFVIAHAYYGDRRIIVTEPAELCATHANDVLEYCTGRTPDALQSLCTERHKTAFEQCFAERISRP